MITGKIEKIKMLDGRLVPPVPEYVECDHGNAEIRLVNRDNIINVRKEMLGIGARSKLVFDGTKYVETDFRPTNNSRIEIDFMRTAATSQLFVFGCRSGRTGSDGFAMACSSVDVYPIFGAAYSSIRNVVPVDVRHTAVIGQDGYFLDGELLKSYDNMDFASELDLYIGGLNQNNSLDSRLFKGEIYSVRLFEDNVLAAELMPAIQTNGNINGFYELCSGRFYPQLTNE